MGAPARRVTVIGPESTGGRFICRWLNHHEQIEARHWSLPHGPDRTWPCIDGQYEFFEWDPEFVVVTTRSWVPTSMSQARHHLTENEAETSIANIQTAMLAVFQWLGRVRLPFHVVHYEMVARAPSVEMSPVFTRIGLNLIDPPEPVVNGDDKWIARTR